jgi:hypothetical protein
VRGTTLSGPARDQGLSRPPGACKTAIGRRAPPSRSGLTALAAVTLGRKSCAHRCRSYWVPLRRNSVARNGSPSTLDGPCHHPRCEPCRARARGNCQCGGHPGGVAARGLARRAVAESSRAWVTPGRWCSRVGTRRTRVAGKRCAHSATGASPPAAPPPEAVADGVHYHGIYAAGCYNRLRDEIDGQVVEKREHGQPAQLARSTLRHGRR